MLRLHFSALNQEFIVSNLTTLGHRMKIHDYSTICLLVLCSSCKGYCASDKDQFCSAVF